MFVTKYVTILMCKITHQIKILLDSASRAHTSSTYIDRHHLHRPVGACFPIQREFLSAKSEFFPLKPAVKCQACQFAVAAASQ